MQSRYSFFLAGESGMGIDSSGEIVLKALAHLGYWVASDREYPSLIKGGQANFNIHCSTKPVLGPSEQWELGVGMGKTGLLYALQTVQPGGIVVHNFEHYEQGIPGMKDLMRERNLTVYYIPTREIIRDLKVHTVYENTIMIGATAKLLGMEYETIKAAMFKRYGKKKALRDMNVTCLDYGYELIDEQHTPLPEITDKPTQERIVLDGNTALAMGAVHAGVRTFFAYPMSPSSSILGYLAKVAPTTGMVVRQVEDEISAVQMALGSMYSGTRSMTATSGGGFDLMTETISLSGMTEVPLVVVIAQRPGPATGLPTWTAQGDLNLAIYGGHGEFARIVCAVSDQTSAFETTQHAFNLAEKFQVPVILLTEKQIAENRATVPVFEQGTIPIERGLVTDPEELQNLISTDRYKLTETGISKRWIPGSSETIAFSNGDEHHEDGALDESEGTEAMIAKRIKKLHAIEWALPAPELFGNRDANILYVGRGSSKGVIRDAIDASGNKAAYCHCEFLFPLKRETLKEIFAQYETIVVVENNATGQFCGLLKQELGDQFTFESIVKSNGRHFVVEEILEDLENRGVISKN